MAAMLKHRVTRNVLIVSVIFLALLVVVTAVFFGIQPASYRTESVAAEIRHLATIEKLLASKPSPNSVPIAIGVSQNALSKAFKNLEGSEASTDAVGGLVLKIVETRLEIEPGHIQLSLSLDASPKGLPVVATLNARGVLLFDQIALPSTTLDTARAHYTIGIREITATVRRGTFSLPTRYWINRLIASNLGKVLAESFKISIPIHLPKPFTIGFSQEKRQVGDHGSFTIKYSMPNSVLTDRDTIRIIPAIPSDKSVWFLALFSPVDGKRPAEYQLDEDNSTSRLQQLRRRVAKLVADYPQLNEDVALYANVSLFETIVANFNGLTPDKRQVTAELISKEGYLAHDFKSDKVLGRGGYSAAFQSDGSLSGSATISPLRSTWTPGSGVTLDGRVNVRARSRVKLHIDPYIGSGFTTTVGIEGSATVPLRVRLDARHVDVGDGRSAFAIGPVIECHRFPLRLENNGFIKFGIITQEFVGKEQPNPLIVTSSDMIWSQLLKTDKENALRFNADYWAGLRVTPVKAVADDRGYRFFSTITTSISTRRPSILRPVIDIESIATRWKREVQPQCPPGERPTFLFAGLPFGPNNEIVKAGRAIAKAAGQGKRTLKLSWDRIETVVKNPKKAPEIVKDVVEDVLRESGTVIKEAEKFFKRIFEW